MNKLLCSHWSPCSSHLCVLTIPVPSVPELASARHFFSSLFYSFSLCVGAFIFLREHGRARSLCPLVHCRFCPLVFFFVFFCTVLFSLSLPSVGRCSPPSPSFLPHPLALSLLFCSLCARCVSWALTSRCDPSEPRWLWYTVQPSW